MRPVRLGQPPVGARVFIDAVRAGGVDAPVRARPTDGGEDGGFVPTFTVLARAGKQRISRADGVIVRRIALQSPAGKDARADLEAAEEDWRRPLSHDRSRGDGVLLE